MSDRNELEVGAADMARIDSREGEMWGLVLVKELKHPPERVWRALTDPDQLRQWAPFDADRDMGAVGPVTLTTVGAPSEMVSQTSVTRVETGRLLEYVWGGGDTRWQLETTETGTRLTLWANINRHYIAMGAAGWQVCLAVVDRLLEGNPTGRLVAQDALQHPEWQRLNQAYSAAFGVEAPKW